MSRGKIFLKGKSEEQLIPMQETEYEKEDVLQVLLAKYPDLLPGDQIDPDDPPRWLLVGREIGVPGDMDESGRWSLDHLYIDHNSIPTFVECKRSSDTRNRREVVAQMLDYAANGTTYWSVSDLREAAAKTAASHGKSLEDEIVQLLEAEGEPAEIVSEFWKQVEENLRKGHVRLIFVTDETPRELRRLVEFLNSKMEDVEVLAIEVKQFLDESRSHSVLVPRVIGATEAARRIKGINPACKVPTNRVQFLAQVADPKAAEFFARVLDLADQHKYTTYWGVKGFSVRVSLPRAGHLATFVYAWPVGSFQFFFGHLPLSEDRAAALRQELMAFGVFEESGEKTLTAPVNRETISSLNAVYDFLLERMHEIAQTL